MAGAHYLSILWLTPLAASAAVLITPTGHDRLARAMTIVAAVLTCAAAAPLWIWYDRGVPGFQMVGPAGPFAPLGWQYAVGLDGLSVVLVTLTSVAALAAALSPMRVTGVPLARVLATLLFMESALVAAVIALDLMLFAGCVALALGAIYIGIYRLGGVKGSPGGRAYLLLAAAAVGALVLAAQLLSGHVEAAGKFDLVALSSAAATEDVQPWTFLVVLAAGILLAVVPLVALWSADTAPPAGVWILVVAAGAKLGIYALLRVGFQLAPAGARQAGPAIAALAVAVVACGVIGAWRSSTWQRLVTAAALSSLGLTLLTTSRLTPDGFVGGMMQPVSHGIGASALLLVVGTSAFGATTDRRRRPSLAALAIALALTAFGWAATPTFARRAVNLTALDIAARLNPKYAPEFAAACDTTVTPAMKAASPASQFLEAAPCGPDGKPLSPGASPSTAPPSPPSAQGR